MSKSGGGVSSQSVGWLTFVMRVSMMVIVTPFMAYDPPYQSLWLVAVFTFALGTMLVWLISLAASEQDTNIVAQARARFGRLAGPTAGLVLGIFWIVEAATALRNMGEAFVGTALPLTPVIVLIVAMAVVSAAIARRGIGLVCAMSGVLGALVLTAGVLTMALPIGQFNPINLRPMLPQGLKPLVLPALSSTALWAPVSVVWMIRPRVADAVRSGRQSLTSHLLLAVCMSSLLLVMLLTTVPLVFGPLTGQFSFVTYSFVRNITVGRFVERIEVLALGAWLVTTGITVAALIWAASQALGETLGLNISGVLVYPVAGICVALSGAMFETSLEAQKFASANGLGATSLAVLLTFSLVMIAARWIRRLRGGGPSGRAGRATLACIVVPLALALSTSGCWDRREIEDLGFIVGCAVDTANAGDAPRDAEYIQVSVVMVKPWAMSTGGGAVGMEKVWVPVTATGRTMIEAVRNLNERSSRRPYWSHNRLLAFGQDMAVAGVDSVMDFFLRGEQRRLETMVGVVDGGRGWDLVSVDSAMERLQSVAAEGTSINTFAGEGTTVLTTVRKFLIALSDHGVDPLAARIVMVSPTGEPSVTGSVLREDINLTVEIQGSAAFRGAKLAGWLDGSQTRGVNWIRGDVAGAGIPVSSTDASDGDDYRKYITVRTRASNSQVEVMADSESSKVSAKVRIRVDGMIAEVRGEATLDNDKVIERIESGLAEVVKNEALSAVRRLQQLKSDAIGFGRMLMASDLAAWRRVESRWEDAYQSMEVDIDVEAHIERAGLSTSRHKLDERR